MMIFMYVEIHASSREKIFPRRSLEIGPNVNRCIRSFASSDSAWTISEAEPVSILDHTSFWGAPDVTFARLSVSIDCQDSRSSGTILTDLRHPSIAIPMRGNCPHTVERSVVHRLYRSQNQHVEATRTGAKEETQNPSRHTCQCQWDNNTRQHLTALYHAHLNTTVLETKTLVLSFSCDDMP